MPAAAASFGLLDPDYPATVALLPEDGHPLVTTHAMWFQNVSHALAAARTSHPGWFERILHTTTSIEASTLAAAAPLWDQFDQAGTHDTLTTRKVLWDSALRRKALTERSKYNHGTQEQAVTLAGRVVAVTGHRSIPESVWPWVLRELDRVMTRLDPTLCITGMALGTDMAWADTSLTQNRPFAAYVPFPEQPARWPQTQRQRWETLLSQANEKIVCAPTYSNQAFHHRNSLMVRRADTIVAVYDGSQTGGTAAAYRDALRLGRTIIRVDPARETTSILHGNGP